MRRRDRILGLMLLLVILCAEAANAQTTQPSPTDSYRLRREVDSIAGPSSVLSAREDVGGEQVQAFLDRLMTRRQKLDAEHARNVRAVRDLQALLAGGNGAPLEPGQWRTAPPVFGGFWVWGVAVSTAMIKRPHTVRPRDAVPRRGHRTVHLPRPAAAAAAGYRLQMKDAK